MTSITFWALAVFQHPVSRRPDYRYRRCRLPRRTDRGRRCPEDKSLMLPTAPVVPRSPSRRQTSTNTPARSVAISPVDKSATISVVLILTPIYLCNIVLAATSRGGRGVARIEVPPNCQLFLRWFADGWASDETRGPAWLRMSPLSGHRRRFTGAILTRGN